MTFKQSKSYIDNIFFSYIINPSLIIYFLQGNLHWVVTIGLNYFDLLNILEGRVYNHYHYESILGLTET